MAASRIADSVGRVLGDRYRLLRPVGMGASAHVYVAEDVRLRRRVAVKVLHPALAEEEAFLRRFRAEARVVASLRHPNILRIYDWGEDQGFPYLVMELLEGGSLRSMLDRRALLSPGQAASVGADAARALDYAHRQGLVHRDVKPANLIFDDEGRVTVADFGLARALAEATWTEPSGAVIGTARYAAPEVVQGALLDGKADVYALAIVLVEAVTGQAPFTADTALGTLMARSGRDLPVPEEMGRLRPVLEAAGRADPGARMDAGALARELEAAGRRLPPPAPLPLTRPEHLGIVESDEVSPTELPGRPRVFDVDAPEVVSVPGDGQPGWNVEAVEVANGVDGGDGTPLPSRLPAVVAAVAGADAAVGEEVPRRRSRLLRRVAAVVAILLIAAGGVGAWAVASGRLTPSHPVPDLVGDSRAAATAALSPLHFHLQVTDSTYSARYPKGAVISQTPSGGRLREGSAIRVLLSAGPQPVPVPKVAGDTQQAAEQALQTLGLRYAIAAPQASMTVPAGSVISSSPASGTLLPGQTVTLVISSGKPRYAVPAVPAPPMYETYAQAVAALQQAGFQAAQATDYNNTVPKGDVIGESPSPGDMAIVGSTVTVTVSEGPHMVAVPPVAGQSVGSAASVLQGAGLGVNAVQGNPLNTVTSSNPPAGTQVLYGSQVTLITG